jgi:hypothetical protein
LVRYQTRHSACTTQNKVVLLQHENVERSSFR